LTGYGAIDIVADDAPPSCWAFGHSARPGRFRGCGRFACAGRTRNDSDHQLTAIDRILRVRFSTVIPGERWWAEPPLGQATYLTDVDPGLLSVGLDPVPADAPAILRFRPAAALRVGQYVNAFLDALDEAALGLFPRWLPGAGHLDGPSSLSVAAVRALAAGLAGRSAHFGPFLAAEPALLTRRRLARLDAPSGHAAGRHPHCEPRPGHPGLGSPDDRQGLPADPAGRFATRHDIALSA